MKIMAATTKRQAGMGKVVGRKLVKSQVSPQKRGISDVSGSKPKKAKIGEEKEKEVGAKKLTAVQKERLIVLSISCSIGGVLLAMGIFGVELGAYLTSLSLPIGKTGTELNLNMGLIMIALMVMLGPISIYESRRSAKIARLEERLADFLRDIAESGRSGLTLAQAIKTAARGEYGELTPEIKKMATQISWGVPATTALARFAERVNTPLVNRAVTLIREASAAGGNVSKVLEAAANDTKEIQLLQQERQGQMFMYVVVVFIAFVVYLVVILIVYATFVPQMKEVASQMVGGGGEAMAGAFNPSKVNFDEIRFIFILSGLIQGLGDGLVGGIMTSGRMIDGLKLSFVMIAIVFVIFTFVFPS